MNDGYGVFSSKWTGERINTLAHRKSWELYRGPIPDGLFVCHKCDNRMCVNPDHLFLGTNQDNMDDMYRKGRGHKAKGEDTGRAKLTDENVRQIRAMLDSGIGSRKIAPMYGVTWGLIQHIKKGRTWRHVN